MADLTLSSVIDGFLATSTKADARAALDLDTTYQAISAPLTALVSGDGSALTGVNAASVGGTVSTDLVHNSDIGSSVQAASAVLTQLANGFYAQLSQTTAPGTPTTAIRLFADTSNRLSWKGTNGFIRTFDGTANTADRIYTLPDAAGTVTVAGNTFNGNSQLVQLTAAGKYPALDGSLITGLSGSSYLGTANQITLTGSTFSLSTTLSCPGTFTASGGTVTMSPTANVIISPSGSVTIAPLSAGTMNNVAIGGTTPLAAAFTTISATGTGTWTGLHTFQQDAGGTTPATTITLVNATAAAAGAQQYSGAIILTGQGWKTTATAASQAVSHRIYTVPVQGTSAPTGILTFDVAIAGGAYSTILGLTSAGILNLANSSTLTPTTTGIEVNASRTWGWTGRSKMASAADGRITLTNGAQTALTRVSFGVETSSGAAIQVSTTTLTFGLGDGTAGGAVVCSGTLTVGASGTPMLTVLSAIKSAFDCPSIAANGGVQTTTLTVTGAVTGNTVVVSLPSTGIDAGVIVSGYVSATNTVTIVFTNCTTGAIDPSAKDYRVTVLGF